MIKVITEFNLNKDVDIETILSKLRNHAATYAGFLGVEHLIDENDKSHVSTICSWERDEDWANWEASSIRKAILHEAEALLSGEPRIIVYKPLTTVDWID